MRTRSIAALAVLAPLAFLSCSPYAVGTAAAPPLTAFGPSVDDVATICVILPSHWAHAVTFVVHDNEQLVGATKGESYFCYTAEPGSHLIVSETFDSTDHPELHACSLV
jgi:hypothetical protein